MFHRAMRVLGLALAVALLAAACGTDTTEVDSLTAERDQLQATVADLGSRLDDAEADLASTADQLAETESERGRLQDRIEELDDDLTTFRSRAFAAETRVQEVEVQMEKLREKYDPEIRAEAQAEVDAEIARACQEAIADVDVGIEDTVHFRSDWAFLTTEDEMIAAVTDCAEPERSRTVAEREAEAAREAAREEAERLAACEAVSPDTLEKNPARYKDTCVHLYAYIVQFDSNTGPCSFHAEISDRRSRRWYDYDVRSTFGLEDSEMLSTVRTDCPELDDIDVDDFVEIWATGLGSFSYDTSLGGSNTVPSFRIEKISLVAKN